MQLRQVPKNNFAYAEVPNDPPIIDTAFTWVLCDLLERDTCQSRQGREEAPHAAFDICWLPASATLTGHRDLAGADFLKY